MNKSLLRQLKNFTVPRQVRWNHYERNSIKSHDCKKVNVTLRDSVSREIQRSAKLLPTYEKFNLLKRQLNFKYPWEWYGAARALGPRTIHCHIGPTNSGKTHAAIQRLKSAKSGVYCAPLRLLAMEMWERLGTEGFPCALRTGEITAGKFDPQKKSIKDIDAAQWDQKPLLSCTVEMLDLNREFEVAIIDEIQMLADEQRGWAFTQAFLGVNSKEIYLCGEEAAVNLMQKLAQKTGDRVLITKYERLSPLVIAEKSLNGHLNGLKSGDCVVAFSRKRIFETKYLIERETGQKCAVVYGKLPMENRSEQAKKFNERQDECSILVASDAVGMGLNLNIQRIIFSSVQQPGMDGSLRNVPPSRIKQIGGRAGRFGFGNKKGIVTCLYPEDLAYMHESMKLPNEEYTHAGIVPPSPVIEEITNQHPSLPLSTVLSAITDVGLFDQLFRPCIPLEQKIISHLIDGHKGLSITERLTLCTAPVDLRDDSIVSAFNWFVTGLARRAPCPLKVRLKHYAKIMDYLTMAESFHRILDLYLWLSTRFPSIYIERSQVLSKREQCSELVNKLLAQITVNQRQSLFTKNENILEDVNEDVDLHSLDRLLTRLEKKSSSS